jgi:thioredoxin 1
MALELNTGNFQTEVLESPVLTMVDFWAAWCAPCRMVVPIIDELSQEYAGKIKIGKLNVDTEAEIATQYSVQSIPTIVFFKNGVIIDTIVGAVPKNLIVERIEKLLK